MDQFLLIRVVETFELEDMTDCKTVLNINDILQLYRIISEVTPMFSIILSDTRQLPDPHYLIYGDVS